MSTVFLKQSQAGTQDPQAVSKTGILPTHLNIQKLSSVTFPQQIRQILDGCGMYFCVEAFHPHREDYLGAWAHATIINLDWEIK